MAKRGPLRIHPPKIPKSERAKVTIANQDKQIRMLIDRCEELHRESDIHYGHYKALVQELERVQSQSKPPHELAYARMEGWRDCAKDIIEQLIDR